jgi:hypothetical protein
VVLAPLDKGKPAVRRARKATGLCVEAAGLPKAVERERPTFKTGQPIF